MQDWSHGGCDLHIHGCCWKSFRSPRHFLEAQIKFCHGNLGGWGGWGRGGVGWGRVELSELGKFRGQFYLTKQVRGGGGGLNVN